MEKVKELLETLSKSLDRLSAGDAVVAKPISIGDRHVLPLCELKLAWAAGGGEGEGADNTGKGSGSGSGGAGGGGAQANPVAVVVIEDGKVRIEALGF